MNFLDNLVLPQSSEHIQLLHYIMILVQFLFIPFISILLIGTVLSVYYRNKGFTEGNKNYLGFAKDIIDIVTINKSIGIILGIVPMIIFLLIFSQLLHLTEAEVIVYYLLAFLLMTVGIIFIYTYRYSVLFSDVFESLNDIEITNNDIKQKVTLFREGSKHLSSKTGIYGALLVFLAVYFFVAGQSILTYNFNNTGASFFAIFSITAILKFLEFLFCGIALTGAAILFVYFYWDGGKQFQNGVYKDIVKKIGVNYSLIGSLGLPLLLTIDILALPGNIITGALIAYSIIGIILLFIGYHFIYAMIKYADFRFSGLLFIITIIAICSFIVKDQLAMSNSTKPNSVILAAKYDDYLKKLKGEDKVAQVSGEQIYKNICSSCHSFDHKIVGPPYKETLPKYEGKINQLVAFIRNPVKKNPNYPPMPNPGLKPNEAQAVAEYILKTYKTK